MKTLLLCFLLVTVTAPGAPAFGGLATMANAHSRTAAASFDWSHLTHYWALGEASGNSRADTKGSVALAEGAGGVVQENLAGIHGTCADFESDPSKSLESSAFSVAWPSTFNVWVNPASTDALSHNILFMGDSGAAVFFGLGPFDANDGAAVLEVQFGTYVFTALISFFEWHMLTFTTDVAGNTTAYIDGASYFTDSNGGSPVPNGAQSLILGKTPLYSTSFGGINSAADAVVDELGIWDVELTPSQVTQLYNGGSGLFYP